MNKKLSFLVTMILGLNIMIFSVPSQAEAGLKLFKMVGDALNFNSKKLPNIKPGAKMVLANGNTYQIVDKANNYEEAYRYASSVDAHLAIIANLEENQMIYNFMAAQKIDSAYIGLADHMFKNNWRWPNGTAPSYNKWLKGQPDRSSKKLRYVKLSKKHKKGEWVVGPFKKQNPNDKLYFIIQWDKEKVEQVTVPVNNDVVIYYEPDNGVDVLNSDDSYDSLEG